MRFNPEKPLHLALASININRGTGVMCDVRYNPGRQIGTYTTLRQYGTGVYLWQIKGGRVHACGTSRKIEVQS